MLKFPSGMVQLQHSRDTARKDATEVRTTRTAPLAASTRSRSREGGVCKNEPLITPPDWQRPRGL